MNKAFKIESISPSDLLSIGNVSGKILSAHQVKSSGKSLLIAQLKNQLVLYEYSPSSGQFVHRSTQNVATSDDTSSYPLWISALLNSEDESLVIRENDGLKVYKIDQNFELLGKNDLFHDAYGKNQVLKVGRFFLNQKFVGLMRRDKNLANSFYVFKSECFGKSNCDFLQRLSKKLDLSDSWTNANTKFYLTQMGHENQQEIFVLRTQKGLEFYKFNTEYEIEQISSESIAGSFLGPASKDEKIIFGSFTNANNGDFLHLNTSGLFLYQQNVPTVDYKMVNYDASFSRTSGWTDENSKGIFVVDVDGDSKNEIIFSGTDGLAVISFDAVTKKWNNLLENSGSDKFSNLVGFGSLNNQSHVFLQAADGSLKYPKIVTTISQDKRSMTTVAPINRRGKIPVPDEMISVFDIERIKKSPIVPSGDLRWVEQWTNKFESKFLSQIPNNDGFVAFNIPLIDLSLSQYLKIQTAMSYNDQNQSEDLAGVGWNIPLMNNYIRVDYRCSIFPEDFVFSFYGLGQRLVLKRDFINETTGNVWRFTVPDHKNIKVFYHTGKNSQWIIETETERFVYGADARNGAVQISLSWEHSRCGKTDTQSMIQVPVAWFLKERRDMTEKQSIFYRYNVVTREIDGHPYTHEITLRSINDDKKSLLTLSYREKNLEEKSKINVEDNGKVVFPLALADDFYLILISIKTEDFTQTFKFNYQISNGQRLLVGIDQIFGNSFFEPILKMDYVMLEDQLMMKRCQLPRGSTVTFEHSKLNRVISPDGLVKKFAVNQKPTITSGVNYKVIAFQQGEKLNLKIHSEVGKDVVTEILVGSSPFKYQVIVASKEMFIVVFTTEKGKELAAFTKNGKIWEKEGESKNFAKEDEVYFGENFIAFVRKDFVIKVFQWNDEGVELAEKELTSPGNRKILKMFFNRRMFVAYDDLNLIIFHLNSKDEWQVKIIKEFKDFASITKNTIKKFDVDDAVTEQLLKSIEENFFQVDGNQILMSKLVESNGVLSVHLHMLLLTANYEVAEQVEVVNREILTNISHEEKQGETKFLMKYTKFSGKFSVVISDVLSGKFYDELNKIDSQHRDSEKVRVIKEFNNEAIWKTFLKKTFLLDWKKYHAKLTPVGVICGDDVRYEMTGVRWVKKPVKFENKSTFKLGKYEIEQEDPKNNELNFYENSIPNQRRLVHKMKIEGKFINAFPAYVAYQASENSINLINFQSDGSLGKVRTIEDSKLLHGDLNGMETIVQSKSWAHSEPNEIHIHPVSVLMYSKVEFYIKKKTLQAANLIRTTAYERGFDVDENGNLSESYVMIPGDSKKKFGWYEEIKSINSSSKVITKERKSFFANGELKGHQFEKLSTEGLENEKMQEEEDFSSSIMDKSKRLEIVDLRPHKLSDGNFAYIGFESYEDIAISADAIHSWNYPKTNIIRKEFSFTGENFLRLTGDEEALEGKMKPLNSKDFFVASCWVRSNADMSLNSVSDIFVAVINSRQRGEVALKTSKVKRQIGEWNYLEILIDLRKYENSQMEVVLRIKPNSNNLIDVDHVRFSLINHDFIIEVFNPNEQVTARIMPNGSIRRKHFNKYDREVVSINEDGNVEEIRSSSLSGRLSNMPTIQRASNLVLKATKNQFHDSIEWWKRWKISGMDESGNWLFAPGQMRHQGNHSNQVVIPPNSLNMISNAIRFDYALNSENSVINFRVKSLIVFELSKIQRAAKLSINGQIFEVPLAGELNLIIEKLRFVVWVDGIKFADFGDMQSFNHADSLVMTLTGSVALENFVTLDNPMVTVEYLNAWNEPTQIINIESGNVAQVTEVLHDSLGRRTITTKATKIMRNSNQPLLSFYQDFIKNDEYDSPKSVWFTHLLDGDVSKLNPECEGFPYKQTEFEKNPSRDKAAVGLPGKEFSILGPYSKKIQSKTDIPFLLNLFPVRKGFTMYTKVNENGSKKVTVFDENDKKVAVYVRVPGSDHILSINEYNSDGRIVKILPPIYHEKANTFIREVPWQFGADHLTEQEGSLQNLYGTHFEYDDDGNVVLKSTPDGGIVEYVYDEAGNRRFMKLGDGTVVYFVYDDAEQLIETGQLGDLLSTERLQQLAKINSLPDNFQRTVSQEFSYSNESDNPMERKAIKKFITHSGSVNVNDEISFDLKDQITKKSSALSSGSILNVKKTFEMNKMTSIKYPKESASDDDLMLNYNYDKRGNLIGIGTPDDVTQFAEFTYTADGQLQSEKVQPNSEDEFVREYSYQPAGYLERISDPFLSEEMTYTSDGYGQKGFGNGIISSTAFKAKWANTADSKHFRVNVGELTGDKKLMAKCFKTLQKAGYLTATGVILKALTAGTEEKLPLECRGKIGYQMSKLMARRQVPKHYGHRYAYGNHQELTKAKYFSDVESSKSQPLKSDSFVKAVQSPENSSEIWDILVENGFISTDQKRSGDFNDAAGKQGVETLIRFKEIENEMTTLASPTFDALKVLPEIAKMILKKISIKQFTTQQQFEEDFLAIYGFSVDSVDWQVLQLKQTAKNIFLKLSAKNLLPVSPNLFTPLNPKLLKALRKYSQKIPEILTVLNSHWSNNLGESPFDMYAYNIDANGNHRLFYNGFQRYQLNYESESNKVKIIKIDDITSSEAVKIYAVGHDNNGNVVQALHKNIEIIEYFATSQRPKEITMTDGRVLKFFYDAIGERILKQIFDAKGDLRSSIKYVRDEKGNVLVDKKTIYHPKPQPVEIIVTKYIYGPSGMIGFIRSGEYFSVAKDHAGSTKLIIKNGKVVASYDYMPYGELMRKFVTNSVFEVTYLYTGQEFDEETGLYNFHARLYDPAIGRFYQIDPQAQSFSPYMYAGNSPITFVDPDGEFFLVAFIVVGAIAGAFIGGAQANNNWNPINWNWKNPNTYLSIGTGALAGSLLPVAAAPLSAAALATAGGIGIGAGYITASAANRSLDPNKWDWKSPLTYGALFDGFTTGFSIVHGFTSINTLSKTFSIEILRGAYKPATIIGGAGFAYYRGANVNNGNFAFWQWNWNEEGIAITFGEMLDGFSTVVSASATVSGLKKIQIKELIDNPTKALDVISDIGKSNKLKELLSKLPKPFVENLSGAIVGIYRAIGDENLENFDISNIKFHELSTYEAFINGFFEGKVLASNPAQINKALIRAKKILKAKAQQEKINTQLLKKTKLEGENELQKPNTPKKIQNQEQQSLSRLNLAPVTVTPMLFPGDQDSPSLDRNRQKRSAYKSLRVNLEVTNKISQASLLKNTSNEEKNNKAKRRTATKTKARNPINIGYIIPTSFIDSETIANQIPNKNFSNTSSFDMLDFGDQWLRQANITGNLTLLNLLVEKFSSTKNTATKSVKQNRKSKVVWQVLISNVVHDFVEYFNATAENLGIPQATLNKISEEFIDLTELKRKVSEAAGKMDFENVSKVLIGSVFKTNLVTIKNYLEEEKLLELYSKILKHAKKAEKNLEIFEIDGN